MADNLPEALEPYPEISSKAYEHPADRAATAALKAVPMLDTVVRKLVEFRYERALRQFYLGNSVKVSERQLPDLWASLVAVARILDVPAGDLYVSGSMDGNARTIGSTNPMIVFDSSLLERLRAVKAVLLEWMRAAELSCDRAATLAVRDPRIVCRTLMVTAGGLPADRLDLDAFMTQAMEYESWEDSHDRVRRFFLEIGATHSYAIRRVSEVMKWVQCGEYDRINRGEYRRRGEDKNVREEASDAMEFYAERFRGLFRELGENVTNLGSQVGDMSQQVADWLRNRGGGSGG